MNGLQEHRIHTPSLFWSVTHHNLPVLFESCILYLHRCTCFAQTPQIKRSTGSCCSTRITVRVQAVPVLDKNKAQICCSARVTDRYPLVIGKLIPRRKKSGRDSRQCRPRLLWCTALVRSVHCVEQQCSVLIVVSSNWTNLFVLL